ncbi:MAG: adenylate/guanylate cyclase domain-containing protein, partial [Desulfobacteraceae bacterium]
MKCPSCGHNNKNITKFCVQCGQQLGHSCPKCKEINAITNRFCSECGYYLENALSTNKIKSSQQPVKSQKSIEPSSTTGPVGGERKYVSVLFSDLCNYTTITERNDPEEIEDILRQIFQEIYRIIEKYDGSVEKTMGDGAMILFGSPTSHEDDAIRAVRAALEIHLKVRTLGNTFAKKIGQKLRMHSGISTGLVVTLPSLLNQDEQGVAGDSVNLASRLADLAQPDEILIESNTHRQSQHFFNFAPKPIVSIKGKKEDVKVYQVLHPVKASFVIHSSSGVQASLIGRNAELSQLKEAANQLSQGKGSIFSICGDAGTGKSRLILELKKLLESLNFLWVEGHAYAYTQKIPYFPLIDMLERIWGIEEKDPVDLKKNKISEGLIRLIGQRKDLEACIGTLHGFNYPETEAMSPDVWDCRLYEAIVEILSALAHKYKTIFCMEDLHWADNSSVRLLCTILKEFHYPAILLCSYRPPFALFTAHQSEQLGRTYQEIHLKELSFSEAQKMMASLLGTAEVPIQLQQFIKERTEGNPFYLEEMTNSLLESNLLENQDGKWQINKAFQESKIPATVQGVITARLDHLHPPSKRLLQEASVIGRSFSYEILKHITSIHDTIEHRFNDLERIDLIRTRSLYPDVEFIFKHALTQEVGYNSLLKKERREIHERIARMMEERFNNRLFEFYETLALHYRLGKSIPKAVLYLMKAGNKSLKCYALTEASQYFSEAYNLLCQNGLQDHVQKELLINLLNQWAFVFYYKGNYKELLLLLKKHQSLVFQLQNITGVGYFHAWLGCVYWHRAKFKKGYTLLVKAIDLCKKNNDWEGLGFASAWLCWTLTEK